MGPSSGNMNGSWCPSNQQFHHSLKINKDSLIIKKSSSPPPKAQQRHPVIIYTHSPKVIHTQPKDFKALVQRLTGMSSTTDLEDDKKKINKSISYCHNPVKVEESESLSGITTSDETINNGGDKSNCLRPLPLPPPPPPPPPPPMAFHHSFIGLPLYPQKVPTNNSSSSNSNNNNTDLLCCNSSSSTTTDPTYDFIDFNVPFH